MNFGDLTSLMKNAGRIREAVEQAHESLGQLQVEGVAGGMGMNIPGLGGFFGQP